VNKFEFLLVTVSRELISRAFYIRVFKIEGNKPFLLLSSIEICCTIIFSSDIKSRIKCLYKEIKCENISVNDSCHAQKQNRPPGSRLPPNARSARPHHSFFFAYLATKSPLSELNLNFFSRFQSLDLISLYPLPTFYFV
jgi:hypothetical protein